MKNKKLICGRCGYFMRYTNHSDGTIDKLGDCASISMNKECYEGKNPFKHEYIPILQVEENEDACVFFKTNATKRVKEYIKKHPKFYLQK